MSDCFAKGTANCKNLNNLTNRENENLDDYGCIKNQDL